MACKILLVAQSKSRAPFDVFRGQLRVQEQSVQRSGATARGLVQEQVLCQSRGIRHEGRPNPFSKNKM